MRFFQSQKVLLAFCALLLGIVTPEPVLAHEDDYLNETFVYQTIEEHEFEPEYGLEFGKTRGDGNSYFLNSLGFEYGITSRWMVDGEGVLRTTEGDNSFQRAMTETRYRFAEEGQWPVDVAISLEYEFENEAGEDEFENDAEQEHFISPRLILSKDIFPKLNTTLNLFCELNISDSFGARAGYALGLSYPVDTALRYGLEVQGLHPSPNETRVIPQIWFSLPPDITLKLGVGVGFLDTEERFFVRGVVEFE